MRHAKLTIGSLAGLVVVLAGAGAYLQTSLGGPGSLAFEVRLLLVSVAVLGAALVGLASRMPSGGADLAYPVSPRPADHAR
jgi:hypothetical protein